MKIGIEEILKTVRIRELPHRKASQVDVTTTLAEVYRVLDEEEGVAVLVYDEGELVGMFPEATISRSFVPLRGKTGTVRMAMEAGVPVVPGAVWGTQRLFTKGRHHEFGTRRVPISVDWAPPMTFDPDEDPQQATDRMMAVITDLADAAARRYPEEAVPGEDWWVPAHLGGSAPTPQEATAIAREEAAARRARRRAELRDRED